MPYGFKTDKSIVDVQPLLVSGENIKTINNESILGSGNISIQGGSGTVTKITAGTGLSGGDITTSGTINHSNSVTAQTTQAVYPIKIDAQGHISEYGSAVTSMPASDVSSWAKAANKPSYTAAEVGALPDSTVVPVILASTTDITPGTTTLTTGNLYLVYE